MVRLDDRLFAYILDFNSASFDIRIDRYTDGKVRNESSYVYIFFILTQQFRQTDELYDIGPPWVAIRISPKFVERVSIFWYVFMNLTLRELQL